MAYDQVNSYQPPRRPDYEQPDANAYNNDASSRGPNHSTSQPHIFNGQRRPIPLPDGHRRDPAYGVSGEMRGIATSANGHGLIPGRIPGPMGGGGEDPRLNRGAISDSPGRPPPVRWNGERGVMAQQQRTPPPRGNFVNGDQDGYPPHGRPPIRHKSTNDQSRILVDSVSYQPYDDFAPVGAPVGVQRSKTMPTSVAQPQYTAYNPAMHTTPAPIDEIDPPAPLYGTRRIPEPRWPRESVGAVLETYYQDSEYYDDYVDDYADRHDPAAKPNFSRPALSGTQPLATPQWNVGTPNFAQQAHRSQSQPDLRGRHRPGALYDGVVEMPAEVPPLPMNNGYMSQSRSNIPRRLPVGSPVSPSISSVQNGLPVHPSPLEIRETEASERSTNTDILPTHPPPVRPGLFQEAAGHPAPVRQYDTERMSMHSLQNAEQAPVTIQELERLQQATKLNPSDQKLQLTLAKKMIEGAAVLSSEGGRADIKTTRKNRENFIFDAHKIIKRLTNTSHPYPDAMFYLASCYGEGQLDLQVDHERAFNLYQSAAKLNHAPSAYRTAVCCELGAGVRKDPQRAMTWYKKAAALGETPAMFKLGMILWKGLLGQPRNPRDGLIWLKRAADQADENNQHALHELGLLYESDGSDVIIPDINYARELFVRAADLGYSASQFRMGCAYEYGTMGCPIDPRKSIAWYSKAAMKGDHESQLALSGWYLTGSDAIIQQSDTEAYLWARKAAEKGLAKAEYALGYYTEVGIGVSANLDEAKRWYYKAASQQHPKAQLRLQELKKGGVAVQKSRERLSRSNVKNKDDGDCVIM